MLENERVRIEQVHYVPNVNILVLEAGPQNSQINDIHTFPSA
ncbi:12218_t:CDS:2 [Funneliformis mosseae]|uniref:12218_t:CDS:1 n=1 Tax=Funneliformis mosseae TaxID=27381 RepID=A0A9N9CXG3_FUNMO|nr:12218_t:CDS:2 [Funneliformis mosseae]